MSYIPDPQNYTEWLAAHMLASDAELYNAPVLPNLERKMQQAGARW